MLKLMFIILNSYADTDIHHIITVQYDHFILMMLAAEWVWPFLDTISVLWVAPYSHADSAYVYESQKFPRSLHIPRRHPLPLH